MKPTFLYFLFLVFAVGCSTNNSDSLDKNNISKQAKMSSEDLLHNLLDSSAVLDTFEFNETFGYIKTGYLFNKRIKNAVLIYSKDSSNFYTIEAFAFNKNKWESKDRIDSLEIFPPQFLVEYVDYNFDDTKDILFQKSASNGISLSYRYLLTIDSITCRLKQHPAFTKLSNTEVDIKNKQIKSVVFIPCPYMDSYIICPVVSEWKNDTIVTLKTSDCCKPLK